MKNFYRLFLSLLFIASISQAQNYCNEWINFSTNQPYSNQQYFKVNVWTDGIYRISPADLAAANFPGNFNPKQLQLFYNGQEQYIHVEGEADGIFDANDYIEFYGRKNDGSLDSRMYRHPDHHINKRYSLTTDTAVYFLTLNANAFTVNRRMGHETDVNFIGYTPVPYCMGEGYADYKYAYNTYQFADVVDPEFDEGEGYWSDTIHGFNPTPFQVAVPNVSTDPNAPLARAYSAIMGKNNDGSPHTIQLDVNGAVETVTFIGYAVTRFDFPLLSNSSLSSGTATFTYDHTSNTNNKTVVSFNRIEYPRTFNYTGETGNLKKFELVGSLGPGKSMLSFTNLGFSNPRLYMFAGDTLKRVDLAGTGNSRQALVPTYGLNTPCFLTETVYTTASGHMKIEPVNNDPANFARFTNFQFINAAEYLIVSHKSLMNKAQDYKNFRSFTHNTLLVDVEELYNQFAWGTNKHPLAIRHFCNFAADTFTVKPEYLLLIGKSISPLYTRNIPANWNANLVPTYGYPASDLMLTVAMNDTMPRPRLAVGRISASNENDVQAYLDKMIAHDQQLQQCPQPWMKNILHFGGGNNIFQQGQISDILKQYENIAEDTLMGANVYTFLKTSSAPIQVNLTQYLQALIDSGCTIMTFVAHASGTSFDISTDLPQNYNNKDKYPVIIANSCFVGDIHHPTRRIAEDFVMLPDKGSIGFIAEPSVGYLEQLQVYTAGLYQQIAKYNYLGTLGQSMLNAIDSVYANPVTTLNSYTYYMFKSVNLEMTLSGDPALVLNAFDKPDYEISSSDIFFTPTQVTSEIDSFDVNVVISNYGMATNQPFTVHLLRQFQDGTTWEKDTIINYVTYADTIVFRVPLEQVKGVGLNSFNVYVDYLGIVSECNENNNIVMGVPLIIRSTDIIPVYPAEFSIVPVSTTGNGNVKLKASTVNPFAPPTAYAFEIDTVDTFNSGFLQQDTVVRPGGIVEWELPFALSEDKVYYWRVSRDSLPTDTIHPQWKESSFIHKAGKTGWSQAHYSQFKKDNYSNVIYSNTNDSTFQFVESSTTLLVRNYATSAMAPPTIVPSIELNTVSEESGVCQFAPSIHVFVIDSLTLKLWSTENYNFQQVNFYNGPGNPYSCRARYEYYFIFRDTPTDRAKLEQMLDAVPEGNYVGLYSAWSVQFSSWSTSLKDSLIAMGADSINFINDGEPYIFFTKKGDNSFTQEAVGDSINTIITISATLGGNWTKGLVSSVEIGPASQWTSFHWEQFPLESSPGVDSAAVDIIGIMNNGQEVPLSGFTGIQPSTPDLPINSIDPVLYPRLRLRAYLQDTLFKTPPQLKRWQIYFDEIPELALNPSKYFKLSKDSLQEGESLKMEMAIENIGNVKADSLLTDFYVFDKDRVRHNISSPRYKETFPGDTIVASVSFSTDGYPGLNSLWIEANPNNDQPEQHHFNNIAEIPFNVNRDITNPILDVTFDGAHIMNGDIVSGKPTILVRLKDENKYLALNDTSDWQVFLRDPSGTQKKLAFETSTCSGQGNTMLKWCPASLPENVFRIEYRPVLLQDGIYELWVQAADESGNISGDNSYRITFEVINKSTITEVINYPNPFSTSTRFVFTLTGSEIPEYFKIQIITVTGKVIREITREELGPIRVGRNVTEYAWNGKDEFGDQLANGVYLYRVITTLNGAAIEKRETEADKFFTKGWGKMYLMR